MSIESLNAFAAIGTFVVITATAIAALVQLRHLRVNNQLQGLLAVLSLPYEPALAGAFEFVTHELETRMQDAQFRKELEGIVPIDRRIHLELRVCDYYERLGSVIKNGLFPEELYFDNSSPERYWLLLEPVVAIQRRTRGPVVYENFEYLVARSLAWDKAHPSGDYPKNTNRLDTKDKWFSADHPA